jgi:hypothetical protein
MAILRAGLADPIPRVLVLDPPRALALFEHPDFWGEKSPLLIKGEDLRELIEAKGTGTGCSRSHPFQLRQMT